MTGCWLAIDTATEMASVAAGQVGAAASGAHVQGARRHAAEIVRLIDFALGRVGVAARDLEGIVVGDGPGSFTGLRIGWAAAKGLAQEAGIELRAVPSLMATAAGAGAGLGPEPIAAWFDALRGQVYGAVYVFHPDRVETIVLPAVLTPDEFTQLGNARPKLVAGDGAVRHAEAARRWSGASAVPPDALPPGATTLLSLVGRDGAGRAIDDLTAAEPVYGRRAEAQVKWEASHGRPLPDSIRRAP